MKCVKCLKIFPLDELDTDSYCYECANSDPDYDPDTTSCVKELLENTINTLATSRKVSSERVKSDWVNEHVYKNALLPPKKIPSKNN